MAHNYAKMNWTLQELGWKLHPPGDMKKWDGMLSWFIEYTAQHPQVVVNGSIRLWHRAANLALH